jgi:hypothetical protein
VRTIGGEDVDADVATSAMVVVGLRKILSRSQPSLENLSLKKRH